MEPAKDSACNSRPAIPISRPGQRPAISQPRASEERAPPWVRHDMNTQALKGRDNINVHAGVTPFQGFDQSPDILPGRCPGLACWRAFGPLLPRTAGHEQRADSPVRQPPLFPSASSAVTEGLNSKIQAIKAHAGGFRSFLNYRTRILFFWGKLDLYPL